MRGFQGMYCVDFLENALLKNFDDICWPCFLTSSQSMKETGIVSFQDQLSVALALNQCACYQLLFLASLGTMIWRAHGTVM